MRRYRLGDFVPIVVQCRDTSDLPASPSAAPQITVYNASGTAVLSSLKMPPVDKPTRTGVFRYELRLSSDFSTGFYDIYVQWTVSGNVQSRVEKFQVVAGGNANGAYIGLFWYPRPDSNWIIGRQEDGQYERLKNPRL